MKFIPKLRNNLAMKVVNSSVGVKSGEWWALLGVKAGVSWPYYCSEAQLTSYIEKLHICNDSDEKGWRRVEGLKCGSVGGGEIVGGRDERGCRLIRGEVYTYSQVMSYY